jgi:hypothetical protein
MEELKSVLTYRGSGFFSQADCPENDCGELEDCDLLGQ